MDGVTIGQYRVTGTIGRGGMGVVYAAEHSLLGRPAAIKVLLPELSQKPEAVTRFFNEARAATAIRHPGIIDIYDFGWTDGAAFIVMEHLEGETLARRLARSRLRWPAAIAIARQIAGALSAAHAKGIVHRDLKPDNVFLVPDPEVPGGERIKLLDFGIAKLLVESSDMPNVTRTGAVMGTPTYMAPEQCRGVAIDHRADLYALGCVVYELCCGTPPFVGEGTGDVLAAHIHVQAPAMTGMVSEVPPDVQALVRRLLAKAPGERVQSAEELIRAIDALAPDRTAGVTGPRGVAPSVTLPSVTTLSTLSTLSGSAGTSMLIPRARARSRWQLAAFSAVMAAVGAAVVVLVMRGGDDPVSTAPAGAESPAVAPQPVPQPRDPAAAPPAPSPPAPSPETATPQAETPAPGAAVPPAVGGSADRAAPGAGSGSSPGAGSGAAPGAGSGAAPAAVPAVPPSAAPGDTAPGAPPIVTVAVDSVPPGAQVILDGISLGTTPFHGAVPRQDRDLKLVLRLAGHLDRTLTVHASRPITERIKLVRPAPAPPPPRPRTNRDKSVNPFD
jgi:serine/threonine protein kinase